MTAPSLLLISTDLSLRQTVRGIVESTADLRLEVLAKVEEAFPRLKQGEATLVVIHLPEDGDLSRVCDLLRTATAAKVPAATLVVSDRHHASHALTLLRLGVADYLPRPLDLVRLGYLVDMLTLRARYAARNAPPADEGVEVLGETNPFLYVRSATLGNQMEQVLRVAPQATTVLLGGETGTGKTRLARLIHERSGRQDQPFLVMNCAALSGNLIESELFGHVKGAFTGADRDRVGKLTDAGRGTLLLDEIDSLPLGLQAKLLRALEERAFEPVGSNRTQQFQARLLVASNRVLEEEVAAGRFRADLFYRLNVVGFYLPPLRERKELIRPMVERFIAEFATRNGRNIQGITGRALRALQAVTAPVGEGTLARTKQDAEAIRITQALQRNNNNRLRAAAELGISRMTLYKKMNRYGLMAAPAHSHLANPGQEASFT
jgi:DNA-binding NtrC family response regulator